MTSHTGAQIVTGVVSGLAVGTIAYFAGLYRGYQKASAILRRHYQSRRGFVAPPPRSPAVGPVRITEADFRNSEKFPD